MSFTSDTEKADIMSNSLEYKGFLIGNEDDPVAVVIDGNAIYKVSKALQIHLDYKKLDAILYSNFPNLRAKIYITTEMINNSNRDSRDEGHSNIRTVLDWLSYHRYTVISRKIEMSDESDRSSLIASMDAEIVTQFFIVAKWAKHIIFFGSNKKYAYPLKYLHDVEGKTITVVSTVKTETRIVADALRQVDNFVDLGDEFFRNQLKRQIHSSEIAGVGKVSAM